MRIARGATSPARISARCRSSSAATWPARRSTYAAPTSPAARCCTSAAPQADRSGDDLHAMDTRQELMSLSARFGLTVTFQQPDKDRYDRILLELAKQYNVQMPSDQLFIKGAAFALRAGGRSPRVAKQFVELLAAGVKV